MECKFENAGHHESATPSAWRWCEEGHPAAEGVNPEPDGETIVLSAVNARGQVRMSRIEVTVIALTTHPIKAYGGVQVGEEVLHQLAEKYRSNTLRSQVNHDSARSWIPNAFTPRS